MKQKKPNPAADMLAEVSAAKAYKSTTIPIGETPIKALKISVSLFPADVEAVDALMERMRRSSRRLITRSDAFRLALHHAASAMNDSEIRERTVVLKDADRRLSGNS